MPAKRKTIDSPGTPSKCALKVLTLAEKVKVIEALNAGLSNVKVASNFNCGRTQMANIINNKDAIIEAYSNGCKSDS